jgi:centromere protein C
VELPPQAIKDPEGVGKLAQVFFVASCQDKALEFALADPSNAEWDDSTAQRVLLSAGDSFYVPPGNWYRLENHSKVKNCRIHWIVIKPIQEPDRMVGSSVSDVTVEDQ